MKKKLKRLRVKRDFRQVTSIPRFLTFIQTVQMSLTDNENYDDPVWGSHLYLRNDYFQIVPRVTAACHLASDGGHQLIRGRDRLIEETIGMLDQIASFLEMVSVNNPDALYTTGFTIGQERRMKARTKPAQPSPPASNLTDLAAIGTGSSTAPPGNQDGAT